MWVRLAAAAAAPLLVVLWGVAVCRQYLLRQERLLLPFRQCGGTAAVAAGEGCYLLRSHPGRSQETHGMQLHHQLCAVLHVDLQEAAGPAHATPVACSAAAGSDGMGQVPDTCADRHRTG